MKRSILTLLLISNTGLTKGQSLLDREVVQKNVLWLTFNFHYQATKRWGLTTDFSHRRTDFLKSHDLSLFRIAPEYWIRPNLFFAAGYARLWSEVGIGNFDLLLSENRLHEQLSWITRLGKTTLTQRFRLEQRWREAHSATSTANATNFTQRYRYQANLSLPLGRGVKRPALVIADEIMFHSGPQVDHGPFEQNRIFLALNQKLNESFILEGGYMYTWQKNLNGYLYQSIHTLRITLFWIRSSRKYAEKTDIRPPERVG